MTTASCLFIFMIVFQVWTLSSAQCNNSTPNNLLVYKPISPHPKASNRELEGKNAF